MAEIDCNTVKNPEELNRSVGIRASVPGSVCFVFFYGISTIVGHFMPNPVYSYIIDIYDL